MTDIAISVQNLGKKYTIGHQKSGSLRESFASKVRGLFTPTSMEQEEFWALKDINFEIKRGEAVGIIGRNGAGKSTLLKILSRITDPSTGRFEINGRVSSLLEVGTGFHPELSGRENIYLNGTILGMKRAEIKAKFDEIVAFSGVEKFIDTPVKHYSSGMKVRLAFSVAAHLEPEILIVDEVLAVGDAEFQKKCLGKMDEVSKNEGRTVLFVSHNMGAVDSLCTVGLLLKDGQIEASGCIREITNQYLSFSSQKNYNSSNKESDFYIKLVKVCKSGGIEGDNFRSDEDIIIEITLNNGYSLKGLTLGVAIKNVNGQKINTVLNDLSATPIGLSIQYLKIAKSAFVGGIFSCDIALFRQAGEVFEYVKDACQFFVVNTNPALQGYDTHEVGQINLNAKWI